MLPLPALGRLRRRAWRSPCEKIDAAATPEHAGQLQTARQVNAVVGLVGAPIVLLGLVGWAFFHWRRFGKDPVYLDDPSILMPAPPPDLTAASGAMVMDGGTSRRALTTAMLDLASRGLIAFRRRRRASSGVGKKVGIDVAPARGDADAEAQRARNARRPIGPAEELALRDLRAIGGTSEGSYIEPDDLPKFGDAGRRLRPRARGPRRRPRLVRREAEQGRPGAGSARGVLAIVVGVDRAGRRPVDPRSRA